MEAELKFERENTSGIAVVGSYLIDAERRLGVGVLSECGRLGLCDSCAVFVKSGAEFLTAPTKAENEQLGEERLAAGERLSCQVKIATDGEIVIETKEPKDTRTEKKRLEDDFKKDFESLPLESKVAKLMELEAMTLNETLSFILNSPYKIGGKVVDILSGFGFRKHAAETGSGDNGAAASVEEPEPEAGPEETVEDVTTPDEPVAADDSDDVIEAEPKRDNAADEA